MPAAVLVDSLTVRDRPRSGPHGSMAILENESDPEIATSPGSLFRLC